MNIIDFLRSIPVIRVLLPMICGIIAGILLKASEKVSIFLLGWCIINIPVLILLNRISLKLKVSIFKGCCITLLFILSGYCLVALYPVDSDLAEELPQTYWLCTVKDFPIERKQSYKITLRTSALNSPIPAFDMLVYIRKSETVQYIQPGDLLLIHGKPVRPDKSKIPHEFNYRKYLFMKGIYYQAFINENDWRLVRKGQFSLFNMAKKIQAAYVNKLKSFVKSPDNYGVISALAVGNRNYLDKETKENYSNSGAMHVLAVSGLHVGLIWYVLNIFFGFLKFYRPTRLLYLIIMLGLLWLYVLVTGMSPSVIRAGIMLSILTASGMLKRGSVHYNPVFLSAFILLVVDPYLILDVGFQLSYLAVLGIMFFQPKIKAFYLPKNRLTKYVWELTSVSIAAQAGTFIPAIYYFNKFPTYFLLTNYVVLPLVTIILILIILSAIFWFFKPLFTLSCYCIDFFTGIMNKGVAFIDSLKGSSLNWLYMDSWEVFFLAMAMFFLLVYLSRRRLAYLITISIFIILLCIYGGVRDSHKKSRGFIALYEINFVLALNISTGKSHYLISRNISEEKKESITRACKSLWLYERVGMPAFIDLEEAKAQYEDLHLHLLDDSGNMYILINDIGIVLIENMGELNKHSGKAAIPSDVIIFKRGRISKIPEVLHSTNNSIIVTSSSAKITTDAVICKELIDLDEKGSYLNYFSIGAKKQKDKELIYRRLLKRSELFGESL
jgi:competence protein ComEC